MERILRLLVLSCFLVVGTVTFALAAAPSAPTGVGSTTHTAGVTSTKNKISISWTTAVAVDDILSGYATVWDHSATTDLVITKTLSAAATSTTSPSLSDGTWYFHIKAVDAGGEYSTVVTVGPYTIDTVPAVSAISPATGSNGTTQSVTISGTDFMDGATAAVGTTDMANVTFSSATSLTATVPAGLVAGTYDVKVTNPNLSYGVLSNGYQVTSSNTAPTVTISPSAASITLPNSSTLTATGTDAEDDSLSYTWTVLSVPTGAVVTDDYTLTPTSGTSTTFAAPSTCDVPGVYTIKVTVSDGSLSGSATQEIVVNSSTNEIPVANAGSDQQVVAGSPVSLDGSSSTDDGSITYAWAFSSVPTGSTAEFDSATSATPSFTPVVAGNYSIALTVTDGSAATDSDTVVVWANAQPVADAGIDQSVQTDDVVTLDGTGSSDANAATTLTYTWTLIDPSSGDATASLTGATTSAPSFTASSVGDYVATLTVNDQSGLANAASVADTVTISVSNNPVPVAKAGPDQNVTNTDAAGIVVIVDGSASTNLPDDGSDPVSYSWQFTAKPTDSTYPLSSEVAATAVYNFTTEVGITGTYTLQLTVTDGASQSSLDTVDIVVSPDTVSTTYSLITTSTTNVNAIGLIYESTGITTAHELGLAIGANCDSVAKWDAAGQIYVSHAMAAATFNNFDLEVGQAYFVSVTADTSFTLTGSLPSSKTLSLITTALTNVNAVALPTSKSSTVTTAHELGTDIGNVDSVAKWDAAGQIYVSHAMAAATFNDFTVSEGSGYFVSVTGATSWVW